MKRIIAIIAVSFITYTIYYDLTTGTLPANAEPKIHTVEQQPQDNPETVAKEMKYQKKLVKPGDTVLSITEKIHKDGLPARIDQIVSDFEKLNKGVKVTNIQVGKTYFFPYYPGD